jgi:hypothetical protein
MTPRTVETHRSSLAQVIEEILQPTQPLLIWSSARLARSGDEAGVAALVALAEEIGDEAEVEAAEAELRRWRRGERLSL